MMHPYSFVTTLDDETIFLERDSSSGPLVINDNETYEEYDINLER